MLIKKSLQSINRIFSNLGHQSDISEPALALTVVIPFYNNHPYLPECLASIRDHISCNHEIIIVDDGSPNRSYLESLTEPHVRVIYMDGQNGPSKARNTGIESARGDYVLFVDSDDTLVRDSSVMIDQSPSDMLPDLLIGQETGIPLGKALQEKAPFVASLEDEPRLARQRRFCSILYRRSFLKENAIRFLENLNHGEDLEFLVHALSKARSALVTDCPFYHYRKRDNSISNSGLTHRHLEDRITSINKIAEHLKPYPEAHMLRCGSILNTNLHMAWRARQQLGDEAGHQFIDRLACWARTHLSDNHLRRRCIATLHLSWDPTSDKMLRAMLENAPSNTLLALLGDEY